MASKGHDFILEMIQMKMKKLGFRIFSSDSHYTKVKYGLPQTLITHRPDSIGYRSNDDSICIGEAKYYGDINSKRTKKQITDYVNIVNEKTNFSVIFGIPASEEANFEEQRRNIGFEMNDRIILIRVPDRLIPGVGDELERIQL